MLITGVDDVLDSALDIAQCCLVLRLCALVEIVDVVQCSFGVTGRETIQVVHSDLLETLFPLFSTK